MAPPSPARAGEGFDQPGVSTMSELLNVSYDTLIPNNVGLSEDKRVLKALEKWHPGYINWWNQLIPQQFQNSMVYLAPR
jgi:benzoyl-CoA 2,3-dioxygenase component B